MPRLPILAAAAVLAMSPAVTHAQALSPEVAGAIELEPAFPQLAFQQGLYLIAPPDGSDRIFVVSQLGQIYTFPNVPDPGPSDMEVFLDLSGEVVTGGERGLLGLAFDPDYATNGEFYVSYTANTPGLTSVLARYTNADPATNTADVGSAEEVLTIPQPQTNHNGGWIGFGPDEMLYYAVGDGGGSGDPGGNAQDTTNLLGNILRLDVRGEPDTGLAYAVPPDNPFVGGGPDGGATRPEIYAYGLRNPWRCSFDMATGLLYAADVGQSAVEEVNIITSGGNYGWNILEGSECFNPPSGCDPDGTTLPIAEYNHLGGGSGRRSVTGGYVYRGAGIPQLQDVYFFGDFLSGELLAIHYDPDTETATDIQTIISAAESSLNISSFGQDEGGELYVLDYSAGSPSGGIYRISADVSTSIDGWLCY